VGACEARTGATKHEKAGKSFILRQLGEKTISPQKRGSRQQIGNIEKIKGIRGRAWYNYGIGIFGCVAKRLIWESSI
jgi:hypothetical protein